MRLFGSERYISLFENMGIKNGTPIEHRMLSKTIEKAQKKIEENNFASRKQLLDYDQVNNDQREIVYKERCKVLEEKDIHEEILKMIQAIILRKLKISVTDGDLSAEELNRQLLPIIPLPAVTQADLQEAGFEKCLYESACTLYKEREALIDNAYPGQQMMRGIERNLLLRTVDSNWMEQIDAMEQLRQGIHLVSYGQKDPKLEYRIRGFRMFDEMNIHIQEETVRLLYQVAPITHTV